MVDPPSLGFQEPQEVRARGGQALIALCALPHRWPGPSAAQGHLEPHAEASPDAYFLGELQILQSPIPACSTRKEKGCPGHLHAVAA